MPSKLKLALPYGVMLAVSVWLYWVAGRIDVDTGGRISPAAWPKAIIVFMALLCVYEIGKRLLYGENRGQTDETRDGPGIRSAELGVNSRSVPGFEDRGLTPMLAAGIGLIALYVVLVPFVGFFLATALFLWSFPLLGGFNRPVLTAVISLVGTFSLAFIFLKVAYISLPFGVGPFRDLSIGLLRLLGVT